MSRFLTSNPDGTYIEEIESMDECKWKINDMCCNDSTEYLGDYFCKATDKRKCFQKEDGLLESLEKPSKYYGGD